MRHGREDVEGREGRDGREGGREGIEHFTSRRAFSFSSKEP